MQDGQQDVYGFPLEGLTAQQRADRAACAAYEARRKAKWQVFVDRRELPTGAALKRYCRKVGSVAETSLNGFPTETPGFADRACCPCLCIRQVDTA